MRGGDRANQLLNREVLSNRKVKLEPLNEPGFGQPDLSREGVGIESCHQELKDLDSCGWIWGSQVPSQGPDQGQRRPIVGPPTVSSTHSASTTSYSW